MKIASRKLKKQSKFEVFKIHFGELELSEPHYLCHLFIVKFKYVNTVAI